MNSRQPALRPWVQQLRVTRNPTGPVVLRQGWTLRPATNADRAAIKSLIYSVLGEYALSTCATLTDADLDDIESSYWGNQGYFAVIEEAGVIVATMGVFYISADSCELRKMYAVPAARGQGLGKYLLNLAFSKARELGYRRMVLETATVLKEAIGLYKKYGFKEYHPEQISARCDQAYELMLKTAN